MLNFLKEEFTLEDLKNRFLDLKRDNQELKRKLSTIAAVLFLLILFAVITLAVVKFLMKRRCECEGFRAEEGEPECDADKGCNCESGCNCDGEDED